MKKITLLLLTTILALNIYAQEISPEIASVKPNDWIKGETQADRIKRTLSNGNYIGVIFFHECSDSIYASDSYKELGNILVEKAKRYFKTENVEMVDLSKIPKNEGGGYQNYWYQQKNYWDTKYKIILRFSTSVGFKTERSQYQDDKASGKDYRISNFKFWGEIKIREFYIKKEKEKSDALGLALLFASRSNEVRSFGPPSDYQLSTIRIPDEEDIMRIMQNGMEKDLSKWVSKKLEYSIDPEYIMPNLLENMISKAENIPVKGESFVDKINRIKADGNAIAVEFEVRNIHATKNSTTNMVKGSAFAPGVTNFVELPEKEALQRLGSDFVKRLNESYGTDGLFELVDFDQLPYHVDVNDTKYKIILKLIINPTYWGDIEYNATDVMYHLDYRLKATATVQATEYYKENGKTKKLFTLVSPVNFGNYRPKSETKKLFSEELKNINDMKVIDEMFDRIKGEEFVVEMEKIIDEKYPKLIGRLNK